ncbi:PREDICTED: calcium uptake protein 3, mitochondrial isoform X2 [Drosophila arizonae]|uniref:Calcium uptake protein 3, mitochondrial isoform X2 n=1 Tax=Drosophila arizonae TaxID=7263 RepID=A0ABM1PA02_DROAR|nr:PREDICTED: calcium uptake protein 3, mitochondrial isoform X2 [Drosophila arizonae]
MAKVVARLTVKTSAFLTQQQSATVYKSCFRSVSTGFANKYQPRNNTRRLLVLVGGSFVSLAALTALIRLRSAANTANAMRKKSLHRDDTDLENVKLTARERRFIKFASVEYENQLYMTPQDFLESVVEQEPRPRLKRRVLSTDEVEKYKDHTPAIKKGSSHLFRNLRDKGIVSYTEYLFLLSVLTKPKSGFRIAFNMFDTDGNQRVDKAEFLVIIAILAGAIKSIQDVEPKTKELLRRLVPFDEKPVLKNLPTSRPRGLMERIFSGAWKEKHGEQTLEEYDSDSDSNEREETAIERDYVDDVEGLQRRHMVPTTLQLHLFGKRGTGVITYDHFYRFMDNLQTEVLELEFNEFSKGQSFITELDFAKILLRYTYLATDEYDVFLERLLQRVKDEKGISFNDFRDFCHFLNNLDDFTIAMRMYTLADRSISKDEFARAAKICTGYSLSEHLIDTVFAIFDADGDGLLHYKEFIAIMKDRLHRGFRSMAKSEGWDAFKHCLQHEMISLKKPSY